MKTIQGRINRSTYVVGSVISVATAGIFTIFFLAPFALLELVIPSWQSGGILGLMEKAFLIIPAGYFLLMTVLLTTRRAQDFGSKGIYWLVGLIGVFGVNHFLNMSILSYLILAIIAVLCLRPGDKKRNKYGGKPPQAVKLQDVYRL